MPPGTLAPGLGAPFEYPPAFDIGAALVKSNDIKRVPYDQLTVGRRLIGVPVLVVEVEPTVLVVVLVPLPGAAVADAVEECEPETMPLDDRGMVIDATAVTWEVVSTLLGNRKAV